MKIIQTINDLEYLKATNAIPIELAQAIEQDFHNLFEAYGTDEDLLKFRLPYQQAQVLLEYGDDVLSFLDGALYDLEYIERCKNGKINYYRAAKRYDHDFQLVYTQVKIHDASTEQWLSEQAEWNESEGDFSV